MKKVLFCMLSALPFCVCFAGCKSCDGIEYTASEPELLFEFEVYSENDNERLWTLKDYTPISNFKSYKDFSAFYNENMKGSNTYLLYREEPEATNPYNEGYFAFYRGNETNDLILEESFTYFDKELGTNPGGSKDDVKAISFSLEIFIKPIEKTSASELKLEFGKLEKPLKGLGEYEKYINLYFGEECFATCFYYNNVKVSFEWFENYFKTNLIYGDEI